MTKLTIVPVYHSVCGTDEPACTEMCYANGPGFIIAIVVQSVSFVCFVYSIANMILTMPIVVNYYKNRQGLFLWTEYNPASHQSIQVDSFKASLIFDINREKKQRIWAPFWDGLFEEARCSGHVKENRRCRCTFDGGLMRSEYQKNPHCPVSIYCMRVTMRDTYDATFTIFVCRCPVHRLPSSCSAIRMLSSCALLCDCANDG